MEVTFPFPAAILCVNQRLFKNSFKLCISSTASYGARFCKLACAKSISTYIVITDLVPFS